MSLVLRQAEPNDAAICGRICYEAFKDIANQHNFTPDFPDAETAIAIISIHLVHDGCYGVVAEEDSSIVGSNFLDERNPILGVGPITIDPRAQAQGVGRRLMRAVMERSQQRDFPGIRLVQAGYNMRSLSLYTKLGFAAREHLSCMQGSAIKQTIPGCAVRPAADGDIEVCNRLCARVHGHNRGGELSEAVSRGVATIVKRDRQTRRADNRLLNFDRVFRARGRGEQRRSQGVDRRRGFVRRAWFPGAVAQPRSYALVSGGGADSEADDDADDDWPL